MGSTLGENTPIVSDTALNDLVTIASTTRSVVLCREPDPSHCHRSTVIAPALAARDATVVHILPDGGTRLHESPLPFDR